MGPLSGTGRRAARRKGPKKNLKTFGPKKNRAPPVLGFRPQQKISRATARPFTHPQWGRGRAIFIGGAFQGPPIWASTWGKGIGGAPAHRADPNSAGRRGQKQKPYIFPVFSRNHPSRGRHRGPKTTLRLFTQKQNGRHQRTTVTR